MEILIETFVHDYTPFLFSLVKSFFKGCQKFKHVPSDAHLRSLHTGYYQDNGK